MDSLCDSFHVYCNASFVSIIVAFVSFGFTLSRRLFYFAFYLLLLLLIVHFLYVFLYQNLIMVSVIFSSLQLFQCLFLFHPQHQMNLFSFKLFANYYFLFAKCSLSCCMKCGHINGANIRS